MKHPSPRDVRMANTINFNDSVLNEHGIVAYIKAGGQCGSSDAGFYSLFSRYYTSSCEKANRDVN